MRIALSPLGRRRSGKAPTKSQVSLFQYQVLESKDTFRLLRLEPGQDEAINCSLHHHILGSDTCPQFRSLSYTWDGDDARYDIHLPNNNVIKVRKNLRNALRSVRDKVTSCWLWIDAICINQESNQERNHQVKLMAAIYGNANVVLVWLQSAGENPNVARAFEFVHAAANYDSSDHSVYRYSRIHGTGIEWKSVLLLCRLRYWTRKWIIQELVLARSVVLQLGDLECPMKDFEKFCRELNRYSDDEEYNRMMNATPHDWKRVIASPAARLALQRSEPRDENQPLYLHQLIERYASNECQLPCDHVYALYSLVGDHRTKLKIDYDARPTERLVAVLRFVYIDERLKRSKVLEFAFLLVYLLRIRREDLSQDQTLLESLELVVPATVLGTVALPPESKEMVALRKKVQPLLPIPHYDLNTSKNIWVLTVRGGSEQPQELVGRPDMTYFTITGSSLHGLAACRLKLGDLIWHFPQTQLVFAVRATPGRGAVILGRAYLFSASTKDPRRLEHWLDHQDDYSSLKQGKQKVSLNLRALLDLGSLAIPNRNVEVDYTVNTGGGIIDRAIWMANDAKAGLRIRRYSSKIPIVGCGRSNNRVGQTFTTS